MRRLWIIFSQATTVCLAVLFVVSTLKPEWLPARGPGTGAAPVTVLQQEAPAALAAAAMRADSHHAAVTKAMPSVVNISTSKEVRLPRNSPLHELRRFLGDDPQKATSLGSGVVVSAGGYILTNNHVVEAADEIEVSLSDGRTLIATVAGNDPETDLAVLRVDAKDLPAITFGSSDTLRVGDVVLAIGNPFGFGQTVTQGIVSALGRSGLGINVFENFIQTDAAINPGNSGGALIDAAGNLVGVNTAIFSRSGGSMGIGFATPVSTAKSVLEQIIKSGAVTRGWIGVELAPLTPALAESFKLGSLDGAIIKGVLADGPADRAGVKPGDVLLQIDGKPIADPQAVLNVVTAIAPGSAAKVKLKRKGQDLELPVTIGRRPRQQARPE
ncbi:MAG: trypsin-like peptidase domain-containing protein [Burkholderiales bacterium]